MTFDVPLILEVLIKLGVAAILGGMIGFERELHGRPAGIRTHMMLVIGVTLFSEVSKVFGGDEARIAAQVVTGVGFLGAGTIMRMGAEIKGLTSAASLWAVSAIGMAVSAGGSFMIIAAAATVLGLITLGVVDSLERKLVPNAHPRELEVRFGDRSKLAGLLATLESEGVRVDGMRIVSETEKIARITVESKSNEAFTVACSTEGIEQAHWSD